MRNKRYKWLMMSFVLTLIFIFFAKFNFYGYTKSKNEIFSGRLIKSITIKLDNGFKALTTKKNNEEKVIARTDNDIKLIPGGDSIGVKLFTDGILVVGFSDINTSKGKKLSPAAMSGVEIGDRIIKANGQDLTSSRMFAEIINKCDGKEITVEIVRKNEDKTFKINPIKLDEKKQYKIGLWIRDSTAGVGTLTFIVPDSKEFGALGHPINDIDTGGLIKIKEGRLYRAKVISVEEGVRGKPGELRGIFSDEDVYGKIMKNTQQGIYGRIIKDFEKEGRKPIPVAKQSEIKEGPAKILTSLDEGPIKEYDIYIDKCNKQTKQGPKSMVIRVTDKVLLEKTGGIVQGMSGSPIIQDGKMVGAVTHVFVNRPDMGYGIYVEWMLKDLGINF